MRCRAEYHYPTGVPRGAWPERMTHRLPPRSVGGSQAPTAFAMSWIERPNLPLVQSPPPLVLNTPIVAVLSEAAATRTAGSLSGVSSQELI
jgi:hypothetical protein